MSKLKFKGDIFKSTFYIFLQIDFIFFLIYIYIYIYIYIMFKNLSDKYYQENKERLQKINK